MHVNRHSPVEHLAMFILLSNGSIGKLEPPSGGIAMVQVPQRRRALHPEVEFILIWTYFSQGSVGDHLGLPANGSSGDGCGRRKTAGLTGRSGVR